MLVPTLGYGGLIEDRKFKSKKGHNSEKKKHFELSPLIVWIALWIGNTYSEFEVNIVSNSRDTTKCQFLHHQDDNTDAKAIAISWLFSENS